MRVCSSVVVLRDEKKRRRGSETNIKVERVK